MIGTILLFLAILSILVLAHEWGHYFTAKRVGAKVEEFGLGFPPRAYVWKGKGELTPEDGGDELLSWPLERQQQWGAWVRHYAPRTELEFWQIERLAYEQVKAGNIAPEKEEQREVV